MMLSLRKCAASGWRETTDSLDGDRPGLPRRDPALHRGRLSRRRGKGARCRSCGGGVALGLFERGRIVPEVESRAVREIFVYRYRLMYQVSGDEVRVIAVLHGAMDFDRWMRQE